MDEYGNLVKGEAPPEISIIGMPDTTRKNRFTIAQKYLISNRPPVFTSCWNQQRNDAVFLLALETAPTYSPTGFLELPEFPQLFVVAPKNPANMSKADASGRFYFPRSFNLLGPPCTGGAILIQRAQLAGDDGNRCELRLAVSMVAGPPAVVMVRSRALGVAEWSADTGNVSPQARFQVSGCLIRSLPSCSMFRSGHCSRETAVDWALQPQLTMVLLRSKYHHRAVRLWRERWGTVVSPGYSTVEMAAGSPPITTNSGREIRGQHY